MAGVPPPKALNPAAQRRRAISARMVSLSDSPFCARPPGEDTFFVSDQSSFKKTGVFQEMPFSRRLECISRRYLGIAYAHEALGEGYGIDPDPSFRFDALDCMTFVEQTVALALARNMETFFNSLAKIRYLDGNIEYSWRNHIVEADWIPQNQASGLARDITPLLGGDKTRMMKSHIDRIKWISERSDLTDDQKSKAIGGFIRAGRADATDLMLNYIPIHSFFTFTKQATIPNDEITAMLPEVSIVLLLRREEDSASAGSAVAHMGLLITPVYEDGSRGMPVIRHSSRLKNTFMDEPFHDYLLSQMPHREGVILLEITGRGPENTLPQLP